MACEICRNLEIKHVARPIQSATQAIQSGPSIWDNLHQYRKGQTQGCPYCDIIVRIVRHFNPEYDEYAVFQIARPEGYPYHILLDSVERGGRNGWMVVQMYAPFGKPIVDWPALACAEELPLCLDSGQVSSFIRDKLRTCLESHSLCNKIEEVGTPTRLLKVSGDRIALLEHARDVPYAALSYSWGGNQEIKLNSDTRQELLRGIMLKRLPAVMQDAAIVMECLGICYIWIDALCIMQDSDEDWEREAASMASYYSNAMITIAASSSSKATMGFLVNTDRKWHPVAFPFQSKRGGTVHGRERSFLSLEARAHTGPLADRGWTLQENALSTRLVHFTSSEVIWECRTHHVLSGMHQSSPGLQQQFGSVTHENFAKVWYDMVQAYTSRSLTFVSDKLIAISGIAIALDQRSHFELIGEDVRYLAGLWRHRLPLDLLWQTKWARTVTSSREAILEGRLADPKLSYWRRPEGLAKTFKVDWAVPSWSWASSPYTIDYPLKDAMETDLEIFINIQGASCMCSGSNLFGAVNGGQIRLTGPCVTAQLRSKTSDASLYYQVHRDGLEEADVTADTILVAHSQDTGSSVRAVAKSEELDAGGAPIFDTRVICLCVCRGKPEPDDWEQLFGLVLMPKASDEHMFMRVGTWCVDDMEWLMHTEIRTITIV